MAYSHMGTIPWAGGKKMEKTYIYIYIYIYIYVDTYIVLCFTVEGIHNRLKKNVGNEAETRFLSGLYRKVLASTRLKPSKDHSFLLTLPTRPQTLIPTP